MPTRLANRFGVKITSPRRLGITFPWKQTAAAA